MLSETATIGEHVYTSLKTVQPGGYSFTVTPLCTPVKQCTMPWYLVPMSPEDGNEVFVGVTAVQVQGLPSLSCYRYLHATKPHVTSTVFDRDAQRPGLAKHWHMRTHIHILHGARYTGRGRALACASNTRCWSSMGLNMRL